MQVQITSKRREAGHLSGNRNRELRGISFIVADDPEFDARSVARRSLAQPGFLRNCERLLFGPEEDDALDLNSLKPIRER